jgi:two-component system response regulator NreC
VAIRILVIDEHAVVRASLSALLNLRPDLQVVGELGSLGEALHMMHVLQPDVVLIEICACDGVDLTGIHRLRRLELELRVLVLTASGDPDLVREALRAGADGYFPKSASGVELVKAIRAVDRGELYLHPSLTRDLLGRVQTPAPQPRGLNEALTPREIDVLRLIARGCTNREAAEYLTLSVRTVEGYRANLMDKLGMHSRAELVSYAVEHRLLQDAFATA